MGLSKSLDEQLQALTGKGGKKVAKKTEKAVSKKKTEAQKINEKLKGPRCEFCGKAAPIEVLVNDLKGGDIKCVQMCKGCAGKRLNLRKE